MDGTKDFLGHGWGYPVDVNRATGRVRMADFERDIAEAIKITLATRRGERVMRPEFGSNLHEFVFERGDPGVSAKIVREVCEALRLWEPRITDVTARAEFPAGQGGFVVEIDYVVRSTNNPYNLVFPYFITEGMAT